MCSLVAIPGGGGGGGVLPLMAYAERGIFYCHRVYKRVWISQVLVYEMVGKFVI